MKLKSIYIEAEGHIIEWFLIQAKEKLGNGINAISVNAKIAEVEE